MDSLQLVGPQETQFVGLNVTWTLPLVAPRCFRFVIGALGYHDVVIVDWIVDETLRVGRDLLVPQYRVRRREGSDYIGVSALEVPEVVQVAVGQHHKPAIL